MQREEWWRYPHTAGPRANILTAKMPRSDDHFGQGSLGSAGTSCLTLALSSQPVESDPAGYHVCNIRAQMPDNSRPWTRQSPVAKQA